MKFLTGITPFKLDINVEVIDEALQMIEQFPKSFSMVYWQREIKDCGTVACLFGWIGIVCGVDLETDANAFCDNAEKINRVIKLPAFPNKSPIFCPLFDLGEWPPLFRSRWMQTDLSKRFPILVQRVQHYLETGE